MSVNDPKRATAGASSDAHGAGTGSVSTLRDDRTGWLVLVFAVGLNALLLGAGPALEGMGPAYDALFLNWIFQWAFSVPLMAYLAIKGRLGLLAAIYGVVAISVAHYAAFGLALRLYSGPFGDPGLVSSLRGYAAGFTGAAISFLAFQAWGKAFRTRGALLLMAGSLAGLTALGGRLIALPIYFLYPVWQLVFGALILLLLRPRRATRLW